MTKQTVTHLVTEAQAEQVLAEVSPWLRLRPQIDQFREELDAIVGRVWAIHSVVGHYRASNRALAELGPSAQRANKALRAMAGTAALPEMVNHTDLLHLDVVRRVVAALDKLERALAGVPASFSGQQKPSKGQPPLSWYFGFARDLAAIADELGIEVTIQGDRERDPYSTPFTRFVFAVEKLLPDKQSKSLAACAKRIERSTKTSADEKGVEQAFRTDARKGVRAFRAYRREIRRKGTS